MRLEERKGIGPHLYLIVLLAVATLLRLPLLSSNPAGLHGDEACIGYDAYSIWETGRDQYGAFLPLFAQAFGDYDEGLHRYIVLPFVALFGLNELAIRLPNALAGILTVWVFYYLVLNLFQDRRLAFVAALLLAISPWHVHFSRWSVRAIFLPLFFCTALHLFLLGLKQPRKLVLSGLMFGMSLHTYNSARVFIPLYLLGLVWFYRRDLWQQRTHTLMGAGIFIGILAILFPFWISAEGMTRAQDVLVWNPVQIIANYLSYFSPDFLFFTGDSNLRHSLKEMGQLYHLELITVPVGLWYVYKKKKDTNSILWIWLILYPVPAAFTQAEHAIRALVGAPIFALVSALGWVTLVEWIRSETSKRVLVTGILLASLISVGFFTKWYFSDYPKYSAKDWEYGMKEVVEYVDNQPYPCLVSNALYSESYIFILFYTQFSPEKYQTLSPIYRAGHWRFAAHALDGKYFITAPEIMSVEAGAKTIWVIQLEELDIVKEKGYHWREVRSILDPTGKELMKILEVTGR